MQPGVQASRSLACPSQHPHTPARAYHTCTQPGASRKSVSHHTEAQPMLLCSTFLLRQVCEAAVSSSKHPIRYRRLGIWKPVLPSSVKCSRPSCANGAHEEPFLMQAALQHMQERLAPSTDPFSDDSLRSTLIKGHLSLQHSLPVDGLRAAEICFQC